MLHVYTAVLIVIQFVHLTGNILVHTAGITIIDMIKHLLLVS